MARGLLEKVSGGHKSEEAPFQAQIAGTDPNLRRLVKLSWGLIEQDTAMAAALLERSLSVSVSPAALPLLFRLREKDPGRKILSERESEFWSWPGTKIPL